MPPLTDKQKERLMRLAQLIDDGDVALLRHINDLEDRLENMQPEKGDTGDSGADGKDGRDGKDGVDGKDGKDGRDGRDGKDGEDGLDGKDGKDGENGKDGSPDTPEQVRDKLASLTGKNRLDKSAIKGLDEIERKVLDRPSVLNPIYGTRGIQLYTDGTKRGLSNTLNLKAGTGVTLGYSYEGGRNDITINSSSAGIGPWSTPPESPSPDGSVLVFTVGASAPTDVVADGIQLFDGVGYTYSVGQITLVNGPTQYIRYR